MKKIVTVIVILLQRLSLKTEYFINRHTGLCGVNTRWNLSMKSKFQPIKIMRFCFMQFTEIEDEIIREGKKTVMLKPVSIHLE